MDAGLWISGHTVPVSRVQARTTIYDCIASTTLSLSFTSDATSTEASFKALLDPFLGHLTGLSVTVADLKVDGSFLPVDKATSLYGKENLTSEDDDKNALICNIGSVDDNSSIEITVSFVSELSVSSPGTLRYTIPTIHWLESKGEPNYELEVDIDVKLSTEAHISSPSHPNATITPQSTNNSHVHLATTEKSSDLVLSISPNTSYSSCIVERSSDAERSDDRYAMLFFFFSKEGVSNSVRVDWGECDARQIPQEVSQSKLVTLYTFLEVKLHHLPFI